MGASRSFPFRFSLHYCRFRRSCNNVQKADVRLLSNQISVFARVQPQANLIGRCLHPLFEIVLQGLRKPQYALLTDSRRGSRLWGGGEEAIHVIVVGSGCGQEEPGNIMRATGSDKSSLIAHIKARSKVVKLGGKTQETLWEWPTACVHAVVLLALVLVRLLPVGRVIVGLGLVPV